jgi:putative endonuclease
MKEDFVNVGRYGEQIAAQYLIERGYKILERNLRLLRTEIDLIVEKDSTIVFVEVKTRRNEYFGLGLEAVDARKQKKVSQAAAIYLSRRGFHQITGCRFDVISISMNPSTIIPSRIIHCQDAFR